MLIVDGANVVGSRPDGWWRDRAGAAHRLHEAIQRFRAAGITVEGVVGDASPVLAINDALVAGPHDEIILSTLPTKISRWLKMDLPHRVEQRFGLPVTTVIGEPVGAASS